MPYSKNWDFVDSFTVSQAAWLWYGANPMPYLGTISASIQNWPADVSAIFQMLCAAVREDRLPADHATNPDFYGLSERLPQDLGESTISRENLVALARSKNNFPAFLFNTMRLSDTDTAASEPALPAAPGSARTQNLGGRPREYDWDGATIEIIFLANLPDGLPETQAETVEHVSQWFENTYGKQPAISEVKKLVSRIYNGLKERGWKPAE
jgi:hypothetical protein